MHVCIHLSIYIYLSVKITINLSRLADDSETSHCTGSRSQSDRTGRVNGDLVETVCRNVQESVCVCVCSSRHKSRQCVPTDITGSLSAGPTLWELRFKAWHKINIQTHTNKKKRIVSRFQLNKKLPWMHFLDHQACHHSKREVGKPVNKYSLYIGIINICLML